MKGSYTATEMIALCKLTGPKLETAQIVEFASMTGRPPDEVTTLHGKMQGDYSPAEMIRLCKLDGPRIATADLVKFTELDARPPSEVTTLHTKMEGEFTVTEMINLCKLTGPKLSAADIVAFASVAGRKPLDVKTIQPKIAGEFTVAVMVDLCKLTGPKLEADEIGKLATIPGRNPSDITTLHPAIKGYVTVDKMVELAKVTNEAAYLKSVAPHAKDDLTFERVKALAVSTINITEPELGKLAVVDNDPSYLAAVAAHVKAGRNVDKVAKISPRTINISTGDVDKLAAGNNTPEFLAKVALHVKNSSADADKVAALSDTLLGLDDVQVGQLALIAPMRDKDYLKALAPAVKAGNRPIAEIELLALPSPHDTPAAAVAKLSVLTRTTVDLQAVISTMPTRPVEDLEHLLTKAPTIAGAELAGLLALPTAVTKAMLTKLAYDLCDAAPITGAQAQTLVQTLLSAAMSADNTVRLVHSAVTTGGLTPTELDGLVGVATFAPAAVRLAGAWGTGNEVGRISSKALKSTGGPTATVLGDLLTLAANESWGKTGFERAFTLATPGPPSSWATVMTEFAAFKAAGHTQPAGDGGMAGGVVAGPAGTDYPGPPPYRVEVALRQGRLDHINRGHLYKHFWFELGKCIRSPFSSFWPDGTDVKAVTTPLLSNATVQTEADAGKTSQREFDAGGCHIKIEVDGAVGATGAGHPLHSLQVSMLYPNPAPINIEDKVLVAIGRLRGLITN
jgi:hypothetical protein